MCLLARNVFVIFFYIFQLFEKNTLYHLTFIKRILASFLDFFYRGQQLYYYKSKRSAATDKKLYVPSESEQYAFVFSGKLQRTSSVVDSQPTLLPQSHYLIISNLVVLNQIHMGVKETNPYQHHMLCRNEGHPLVFRRRTTTYYFLKGRRI